MKRGIIYRSMKCIFFESKEGSKVAVPSLVVLTASEWRVLLLLADDHQNSEIADELYITTRSVETYVNRIGAKLGFSGKFSLSRTARKNKELIWNFYTEYYNS